MSTYTYFILNEKEQVVKIGKAEDPLFRLNQLQTGNSNTLLLIAAFHESIYSEKELHENFKEFRIKGEWFNYCDSIKEFLGVTKFTDFNNSTTNNFKRNRKQLSEIDIIKLIQENNICNVSLFKFNKSLKIIYYDSIIFDIKFESIKFKVNNPVVNFSEKSFEKAINYFCLLNQ